MLGRVRRSGTLHIECPERQIDVHFVQGRIAETRDSTRVYADTVLGSLLIKRSLVTEEQLDEALREQEQRPPPDRHHPRAAGLRERGRPARRALAAGRQHLPGRQDDGQHRHVHVRHRRHRRAGRLHHHRHAERAHRGLVGRRRLRRRLRAAGRRRHGAHPQPRLRDAAAPPDRHGTRRVPRAGADRRPAHGERGGRREPPRRGHRHLHPGQVLPVEGAADHGRPATHAPPPGRSCGPTATACGTKSRKITETPAPPADAPPVVTPADTCTTARSSPTLRRTRRPPELGPTAAASRRLRRRAASPPARPRPPRLSSRAAPAEPPGSVIPAEPAEPPGSVDTRRAAGRRRRATRRRGGGGDRRHG